MSAAEGVDHRSTNTWSTIVQPLAVRRYLGSGRTRPRPGRSFRETHGAAIREAKTRTVGRFVEQAFLADPRSRRAVSRGALHPSRARRPQGRELLFPQARRPNATTTARRQFSRRIIDDPRGGAAAGKEILVAAAQERRSLRPRNSRASISSSASPGTGARSTASSCAIWTTLPRTTSDVHQARGVALAAVGGDVDLLSFLGIPYRDSHFAAFARPHNVNRPVDTMLTPEQSAQFSMLASPDDEAPGLCRTAGIRRELLIRKRALTVTEDGLAAATA